VRNGNKTLCVGQTESYSHQPVGTGKENLNQTFLLGAIGNNP
jgi:hypothetical protein